MNKREVFDKVAKHLLDQGKVSRSRMSGRCAYRGKDNLSCAVGCLIPDELYSYEMEGMNVKSLVDRYPSLNKLFGEHTKLLMALQVMHDMNSVGYWESGLRTILRTKVLNAQA